MTAPRLRVYLYPHMAGHGQPWPAMAVHDRTWPAIASQGWPWLPMAGRGWPWPTMAGQPWPGMTSRGRLWLAIWPAVAGHGWPYGRESKESIRPGLTVSLLFSYPVFMLVFIPSFHTQFVIPSVHTYAAIVCVVFIPSFHTCFHTKLSYHVQGYENLLCQ